MLAARRASPAFSPAARCVIDVARNADQVGGGNQPVFSLLRASTEGNAAMIALTNASRAPQDVSIARHHFPGEGPLVLRDALSGAEYTLAPEGLQLTLGPNQVMWLVWPS